MATKPHAFRIAIDAYSAAAAQESSATNPKIHRPSVQPSRARLGEFELDLRTGELHTGARTVRLQEQPLQILRMLLEHDGDMVTRDEIQQTLWPDGTIVDFSHSINAAIKKLRRALGDSADHSHYIDTVARRGYRLMVPIQWLRDARPSEWLLDDGQNSGLLPQRNRYPSEQRLAQCRPLQVFHGGALFGQAKQSPGISRQDAGQSVGVVVPRRELENRLLYLERLLLVRMRRSHHRQRCLWRLRSSTRG